MTMRVFIAPEHWRKSEVELDAEEAHHLIHVLRVHPGHHVEAINGLGGRATAEVLSTGKNKARVRLTHLPDIPPPHALITLTPALVREQRMDVILEKATELGVTAIAPISTVRCVVQWKTDTAHAKMRRWGKILMAAIKQSGSGRMPSLSPAQPLADWLGAHKDHFDLLLCGALLPSAQPVRAVLRTFANKAGTTPVRVAVLIGPEGDFTPEEMNAILAAGAIPVSFGDTILRSETAAVYAAAILRYELE